MMTRVKLMIILVITQFFLLNKINFQIYEIQKSNFPIGGEEEKSLVVFFELINK